MKSHKTSRQEIADLFAIADRDLSACQTPGLIPDWQFNIAYNAELQLSAAALSAAGYVAERSNHHHRVIHSLEYTVALAPALIQQFDFCRKKRNISDYERADMISETEAHEMRELAELLRTLVEEWIIANHPNLL